MVDLAPIDPEADPVRDAQAIVEELRRYDETLYRKPRWLVFNKIDLIPEAERAERYRAFLDRFGSVDRWFAISAATGEGCQALVYAIQDAVDAAKAHQTPPEADDADSDPMARESMNGDTIDDRTSRA